MDKDFSRNKEGQPTIKWPDIVTEDSWYNQQTIPLFYHNVLQGEYQKYVGGAYHAEMFTSFGSLDDLLNDNDSTKVRGGGWSRISIIYLGWKCRDEKVFYAHAMSWKVDKFEDLSINLKNYINEREPTYKNPPPLDDQQSTNKLDSF